MTLALARWSFRHLLKLWGAGILLEAALLLPLFVFFVPPEPALVEQLQGGPRGPGLIMFRPDSAHVEPPTPPAHATPWPVTEDSFFTVLHWPLHKPLLAGGGRVITMPMRHWWIPALYVGAVPLALLAVTGAWLLARGARGPSTDTNAV